MIRHRRSETGKKRLLSIRIPKIRDNTRYVVSRKVASHCSVARRISIGNNNRPVYGCSIGNGGLCRFFSVEKGHVSLPWSKKHAYPFICTSWNYFSRRAVKYIVEEPWRKLKLANCIAYLKRLNFFLSLSHRLYLGLFHSRPTLRFSYFRKRSLFNVCESIKGILTPRQNDRRIEKQKKKEEIDDDSSRFSRNSRNHRDNTIGSCCFARTKAAHQARSSNKFVIVDCGLVSIERLKGSGQALNLQRNVPVEIRETIQKWVGNYRGSLSVYNWVSSSQRNFNSIRESGWKGLDFHCFPTHFQATED